MASTEISSLWRVAFPNKDRPQLYSKHPYNEDGFEVLTSSQEFLSDLSILDGQQMHILASNNQLALRAAQDEYMALERQLNRIKHKDLLSRPIVKDPRRLPDRDVYEEQKEAILYGYKYDPKRALPPNAVALAITSTKDISEMEKHDVRLAQDPWTQGGFIPGKRQADIMRAKAKDPRNPDSWTPTEKNGRHLIPKMYVDTEADFNERYGRYGKLHAQAIQEGLLGSTRRVAAEANGTRAGTPVLVNKPLRNTRFNGAKVPQTRDVSEAPSITVSRASTPKRKRGDTPLLTMESGSPASKKAKTTGLAPVTVTAPPRKRHNQYTKAKERAEQEAAAAAAAAKQDGLPSPERLSPPELLTPAKKAGPGRLDANGQPLWRSMTAQEKFEFTQWDQNDLIIAIEEDPSWTSGPYNFHDPNLPAKIQEKLQNIQTRVRRAQNPIRSWAAYRTWLTWSFTGTDKRGPRKRKSEPNSAVASSEEPETPEPIGEELDADFDVEVVANPALELTPARGSRGETIVNYAETDEELAGPKRSKRRTRK